MNRPLSRETSDLRKPPTGSSNTRQIQGKGQEDETDKNPSSGCICGVGHDSCRTARLRRHDGPGAGGLFQGALRQARRDGADGDGFDLAQGWAAILQREVGAFGGIFETRDPNWSAEAGAQALTEAIASDPKPDVLVVMSSDLNSYSKIMKKAQEAGIYVLLIDNPANFNADAYLGGDWTQLGRLEAEAAIKGCGENSSKKIGLVQGDETNATSLFQYDGIMDVLSKHPDFEVVAKPDFELGSDNLARCDDHHASAAPGSLRHHRFLGR